MTEDDRTTRRSRSTMPSMRELLERRISRRGVLRGGLGLAGVALFAGVASAGDSGAGSTGTPGTARGSGVRAEEDRTRLTFTNVANSTADRVVLPEGYVADVLVPWGTPILSGAAAFDAQRNNAGDQARQMGMHHDGMHFFQRPGDIDSGLLVVNHENVTRTSLFPQGRTETADGLPTDPAQVAREMAAHGIAVVKLKRRDTGRWFHVPSPYNRRLTAETPMTLTGPATGSVHLRTPHARDGRLARGTLNNCGRGHTPWLTYLSGEENFQDYFVMAHPDAEARRYGISATGGDARWHGPARAGTADAADVGRFARFDITPERGSAAEDWRNEARHFGWVVEVDPFDPASRPKKRTALGRFCHEGVEASVAVPGRPLAFYMGDDSRGEYCYKFVTADGWDPDRPDREMLDRGTLYVARYNEDGSGQWLPLDIRQSPVLADHFADQAEVLIKTRMAADLLDPTPMDRPEWATVDPATGDIYYTLTNNRNRGMPGEEPVDAANPRKGNPYGHILRQREDGGDPAATTFTWDIFAFGAPANAPAAVNRSGLTRANQFGSPDGLWFDPRGVLWIQTDNGDNAVGKATNNQMLAVLPAEIPGDGLLRPDTQDRLKRFLVGPRGSEITGCALSADDTTLFVNVQHPEGRFPDYSPGTPPRSATLAIRREDGGVIAL